MRNETRTQYNAYLANLARLSGVSTAVEKYTVTPSVQQRLETAMQESSGFLQRIQIIGVDELKGEKIGIGVTGTIAGRTNTATTDRSPRDMKALKNQFYECVKIDSDTAIKYATLDAWAKFPDFKVRLANAIARQQALDRIMIGWNGTSAAATSDRTANPLLQDVAIGWLQHIRADAPDQVFDEGAVANKVTYGTHAAADYKTLDGLVFDNIERLASWYKDDPDLVVVVGRGLMHDKLFPLMNAPSAPYAPTEALAADLVISQKRLGGLQAVQVPFFPAGKALITKLSNLSIYYQMSARRRAVIDNPKRDQVENYESSNDAYVVEDYDACVLVENIEAKDA